MLVGRFEVWFYQSQIIPSKKRGRAIGQFYGSFNYAREIEAAATRRRRSLIDPIYKVLPGPDASFVMVKQGQKILFYR